MDLDTIPNFLAEQRDAAPVELQHVYMTFEDFWERRLWHQLTDALVGYFNHPDSGSQRLPLWRNFILSFGEKINQLKLVTLGLLAVTQCKGSSLVSLWKRMANVLVWQMTTNDLLSSPHLLTPLTNPHHKMPSSTALLLWLA